MRKIPLLTWVLLAVGIVFVAVAIVYLSFKADDLPSFFPGHVAPVAGAAKYTKRATAAIIVAVIAFAAAFFTSPFFKARRKS